MKPIRTAVILTIAFAAIASCRAREPRRTTDVPVPPPLPPAAPREAERLRELALDVQTPRDAYAEADAIRRLRRYLSSQEMTYTIRAVRTDTETPVESPSVMGAPVRVEMQIFRGREHLYSFSFVPRDNRNLALLGQ